MIALVASVVGTAGRVVLGAVLAVVTTTVALRLLGARRGWEKAALAGAIGWAAGVAVAVGLTGGGWTGEGLWIHALMVGVPATMTVAVALDLLARPGSLATAGHAGLVVTPRPLRAWRTPMAVLRRFGELRRLARTERSSVRLAALARTTSTRPASACGACSNRPAACTSNWASWRRPDPTSSHPTSDGELAACRTGWAPNPPIESGTC
jgi:hypothetical protein